MVETEGSIGKTNSDFLRSVSDLSLTLYSVAAVEGSRTEVDYQLVSAQVCDCKVGKTVEICQ